MQRNSKVHRINFRDANKPEPVEKVDKTGVVKWGKDNLYPQFLNALYYDNPVHGGIINQKIKFLTAGGIEIEGDQSILQNGASAYDLQELTDELFRDLEIGDTFCVLFKKSLVTGVWYAEPMDYELIRATEIGVFYEYSDDWSKSVQNEKTNWKKIKSIHYLTSEDKECLLVAHNRPKQKILGDLSGRKKELTLGYYPEVNYSGAITSIMAGIEMDFYTYAEVVNGFKGGTFINLSNGIPESETEEKKILDRLKVEGSDRDKQGGMVVAFSDGKDRAAEVHQLNGNDLDKRYIESGREIVRKIMIAHGVISPALFGVLSETMFGSKEEMEIAYKLFQENYVEVRQRVVEKTLTWAFKKLNGFVGKIKFKPYNPNIFETPKVEPTPGQMQYNSVDEVLEAFTQYGKPKQCVKILTSQSFTGMDDDEFKAQYLGGKFASVTKDQKIILEMINNGESYDAISKALGKGGAYLSNELVKLGKSGMLDGWEVTQQGKQNLDVELEVLYSYEKKPSAPDLVAGGESRPFCKAMLDADKLYTRMEIEQISAAVGRDVWNYRGGWYHNPDTGRNTPSCRHEWRQNIALKS